jgi:hypothetical protein
MLGALLYGINHFAQMIFPASISAVDVDRMGFVHTRLSS